MNRTDLDELILHIVELKSVKEDSKDYDLPSYNDVGRILFHLNVLHDGSRQDDRYEVEVLDYDGSAFWIQEGLGIDYWINAHSNLDLDLDGTYVIEGITGYYHKGTWGFDDDDEEFYFENVRRASQAEINDQGLDNA